MTWNSEDPSKPGLGDAIQGIGQVAAIVATGGAAAAGGAAAGAAAGEAAATGGFMSRIGSFATGKLEQMGASAKTEGSFLNTMNKSYGTGQAGNWAPNKDGEGSHIVTPQEASGNVSGTGQMLRDTGSGLS